MLRKISLFTACVFTALTLAAQTEPVDTVPSTDLAEIVIEAPKVIRKTDRDVFYPSQSAVDASKNGLQLTRNLMIPTLSVNDINGSITSAGQAVEVRINGRKATIKQVQELLPETIKKVEWIDNPGLKYNGANGVLNFVVANPDKGGSLMLDGMQALNTSWGQYFGSLKLNYGKSQWGLSSQYKLTNKVGMHREYTETFTYPDGTKLTREEKPIGGHADDNNGQLFQLDYSYIKPDTTVLYVAVAGNKSFSKGQLFEGLMTLSNSPDKIRLRDYNTQDGFTPNVRAYLEQHFAHNQLIAIDFNSEFYNGHTRHSYIESDEQTHKQLTDVNTSIHDRNQMYSVEADYIKRWSDSSLTAGASYTANRNRSTYENLDNELFHQRQDYMYLFGEYMHRINRVTLSAGVGAQYTSFKFRETGQGNDSWHFRPQFSMSYSLNQTSQFRLSFRTWQNAPSLAETNITPQQTDGFQWTVGNPNLKTSSSYMLTLRYNFTFPRVMGTFGVRAFTSPNAITKYLEWQDDRLVTSYENSKGLQNLTFTLSPQVEIIPDWLMASGTLEYKIERMSGNGYRLYNHNWCGMVDAMVQHWGFQLMARYAKAPTSLWGEVLTWGESFSLVSLAYNWRGWQFTAGAYCPFTKYDQGSRSLNRYNTNEKHTRLDIAPMPFVSISYNVQWGRQKRGANKLVNAGGSVDRSTAGSR